jgi:hypothetical protein
LGRFNEQNLKDKDMGYIAGYHNVVVRMLHAICVQMPLTVWFRTFGRLIPSSARFVNYTAVPDSVLETAWAQAQQSIGTNPHPQDAYNGPLQKPDPRALTLQPSNVAVIAVPDVPLSDLSKVHAVQPGRKDPSGVILIMQNGLFGYESCHAVTMCWARPRVYAAASEVPQVLEYEFENIILSRLGYDVSNR